MDVRGERECKSCGTRWSYFETGSVACPECGSVRSVGVGERSQHTDGNATLDLSDAQRAAAD
ncbi:endonuclease Q family protein, partial [Halobacterium bonnevillei]|nr:TFIIB-type zinc ribbon-containing protein [Halobacterium bonnevillei]